jgi:hypothetical protein
VTFSPSGDYVLTGTAGMKAGVLSGGGEEELRSTLIARARIVSIREPYRAYTEGGIPYA